MGSRPSIVRGNRRGAPVDHACGLHAVGYCTAESALVLRRETVTSRRSRATSQCSARSPVTSKRNDPVSPLSNGSCPRRPSSAMNCAVASATVTHSNRAMRPQPGRRIRTRHLFSSSISAMLGPRGSTGIGERTALFREARNRSASTTFDIPRRRCGSLQANRSTSLRSSSGTPTSRRRSISTATPTRPSIVPQRSGRQPGGGRPLFVPADTAKLGAPPPHSCGLPEGCPTGASNAARHTLWTLEIRASAGHLLLRLLLKRLVRLCRS
jgi:hypothetical protein